MFIIIETRHSRAHIIKPLTDKVGLKKKDKLVCTNEMQIVFEKMRKLMVADTLSVYPDHNLCVGMDVYTDASNYQSPTRNAKWPLSSIFH